MRELLLAGRRRVKDVWLSETLGAERGWAAEIVELATTAGVPVRHVPRERLAAAARTDAPQGVLAHAQPLPEADLDELCEATRDRVGRRPPFLVVLDGVTDPQNMGTLLRTAECAGATGIVLPRHRAVHVTPTVAKSAAGAVEHLPIAVVAGIPSALATLRSAGVWTIGLDTDAARSLFALELATEPVALVLGAEGAGLGRLTRERCDLLVAIPMVGAIPSLNVAAAGAVACFEITRRRHG